MDYSPSVGRGKGRASCVTRTGHSDGASTAWIVDVERRGAPMTTRSAFSSSSTPTIFVLAVPLVTMTSA
jgi:hypothetical protein